MTQININDTGSTTKDISGIKNVNYNYIGSKPTGIQPIDRLTGVFTSDIILADSGFVRWLDASWNGDQNDLNISLFVRSSNTPSTNSQWEGPFYDKVIDLESHKEKYLQFKIVMVTSDNYVPKVSKLNLRYVSSSTSSKFYTKTFDLGFSPENILLTYNADISNDTIVKFSVTGQDSIDPNDYQAINPNEIETLSEIHSSSEKVKVLMELAGEFTVDVEIHELAFMVGGSKASKLNKIELA